MTQVKRKVVTPNLARNTKYRAPTKHKKIMDESFGGDSVPFARGPSVFQEYDSYDAVRFHKAQKKAKWQNWVEWSREQDEQTRKEQGLQEEISVHVPMAGYAPPPRALLGSSYLMQHHYYRQQNCKF